jgi:rRNA pseudouridine-1189 N-methylase Emg1 (Nep1/Mra1 family)
MDVQPCLAVDLHNTLAIAMHSEGKLCQAARYVSTLTVMVAAGCFPVSLEMQNSSVIVTCRTRAVHTKDTTWAGKKAWPLR